MNSSKLVPGSNTALTLLDEAERWLATGFTWRKLRFPVALQCQYDTDTRQARSRTAGVISLAGAVVALLLYPVLYAAVPDMHALVNVLFLQIAVPVTVVAAVIVLLDPPPLWREAVLTVPTLVDVSVLTFLFAASQTHATELYIAGMLVTLIFTCITLQLRFGLAAVVTVFVLAMFGVDVAVVHRLDQRLGRDLLVVIATAAGYILLGNWRLHADQKRNYVLMLRERLRQRDLSQRNLELDALVRQDSLTSLANRRTYDSWLNLCWSEAASGGKPLGLVLIDIDHFKLYNDYYGHAAGDACLQAVARTLRDQCRGTTDQVARIGGEEFAVLLPGLALELCGDIAERLRIAIAVADLPHLGAPSLRRVTISCGAASFLTAGATPGDLFATADAALYKAKQDGRNRVCLAEQPAGAVRASAALPAATAGLPGPVQSG